MIVWPVALLTSVIGGFFSVPHADATYWGRWLGTWRWRAWRCVFMAVPAFAAAGALLADPALDPDGLRGGIHGFLIGAAAVIALTGVPGAEADRAAPRVAELQQSLRYIYRSLGSHVDDRVNQRINDKLDRLVALGDPWAALLEFEAMVREALASKVAALRTATPLTDAAGRKALKELERLHSEMVKEADVLVIAPAVGEEVVTAQERRHAAERLRQQLSEAIRALRWQAEAVSPRRRHRGRNR